MDELITKHSTIMDKYDPEKRIGLIVDEWGSWLAVEPGTNPGFLYQQNTIRDAMVAAVTLNIFHKHADRVKMANIAQTVNVLQSMILTEGEQMVKTPSYYVFELYKNHQDATLVDAYGETKPTTDYTISQKDGKLTLSLCNYSLTEADTVSFDFEKGLDVCAANYIQGEEMDSHNDFDHPEVIRIQPFTDYKEAEGLHVTLPPMSVVTIELD